MFLDTYLLPVKMRCKDLRILRSLRSWNALRDYAVFEIRHKYYKWVRRKPSRIRAFLSRCKEVGRED